MFRRVHFSAKKREYYNEKNVKNNIIGSKDYTVIMGYKILMEMVWTTHRNVQSQGRDAVAMA